MRFWLIGIPASGILAYGVLASGTIKPKWNPQAELLHPNIQDGLETLRCSARYSISVDSISSYLLPTTSIDICISFADI